MLITKRECEHTHASAELSWPRRAIGAISCGHTQLSQPCMVVTVTVAMVLSIAAAVTWVVARVLEVEVLTARFGKAR